MASEVGQGYVSIIPSARGFAAALQREIGSELARAGKKGGEDFGKGLADTATDSAKKTGADLSAILQTDAAKAGKTGGTDFGKAFDRDATAEIKKTGAGMGTALAADAGKAGKTSGDEYGKSFLRDATTRIRRLGSGLSSATDGGAKSAGREGGHDFGKAFADEAVDTVDSADVPGDISSKLKLGLAAGGVAAGAALAAGFGEAMERERLGDKLTAQVGANPQQAKRYGTAAANLFAGAWGESVEDVNNAIAGIVQNIAGMREASTPELEALGASVLDVATAFDEDSNAITRTVGQMLRTGMAKTGREALDTLTVGFQQGANKSQDLLDTFNEYGTQFRKLGLDGPEAMGLLTQAVNAGARDSDVAADALKEFSIRSVEALTTVDSKGRPQLTDLGKAFETLGVEVINDQGEVDRMGWVFQNKLAAGGESARDALGYVTDRLRDVRDPLTRSRTAVALFGTQAEDMGDAVYAFDPSRAVKRLGNVRDAAKRMGDGLNDNATTRFTEFKRSVQTNFVKFIGDTLLPAAEGMWKEIGPDVKRFGRAVMNLGEDLGPVAKDVLPVFANVLGDVAGAVGAFARQFNKLPAPLQAALIGGGLFALARRKGGGGIPFLPALAPAAAPAAATAAGAGAGTAAAGGAVAGGAAARVAGGARAAGIAAIALYGGQKTVSLIQDIGAEAPKIDALGTSLRNMSSFGAGKLPGEMEDLSDTVTRLTSDSMAHRFERWAGSYDQESEEVRNLDNAFMRLANERGLPAARKAFRQMAESEDLTAEETKALISIMPGYRRLLNGASDATGKHAKDLDGAREAGWKLLGLWRRNLLPTTKDLTDKFGLTAKEADLLRRELGDATGTGKQHEKQLRQVARQLGLNKQETQDLIDKYGDLPKKVETRAEFLTREAANARDQFLRDTKGKFSDLGNDTYAIMVNGTSGHGRVFAEGGIEKHTAQIARPGTRVWAEPETGGEAYIPLAQSKRSRSLDIWAQTGRELGVQGFADGGITGRMNTKVKMDLSQLRQLVRETVRGLQSAGGSVPATLAWAKRQVGDPYLMGGVGPNVWDCSGFMSAITNHLMGREPYQRLFATSSFPTSMFGRGPGTFMIGSTPDAGGGIGHMAGTLGGTNVESSGGVGVRVGGGARGARDPLFGGNVWHLKPGLITRLVTGGGSGDIGFQGDLNRFERYIVAHESGGSVRADNPDSTAFGIGQLLYDNRRKYATRLGVGPGTLSRDAQIAMMRMYMEDRYGSSRAAYNFHVNHGWYDNGGTLKPGYTLAYNGTGQNEYVQPPGARRIRIDGRISIDNWRTGEGRMRGIAREEVDGQLDFEAVSGRMG